MMDCHELNYELTTYLQRLRCQLANSGTGDIETWPEGTLPVIIKAHQQATDLLKTLESDEFEDTLP